MASGCTAYTHTEPGHRAPTSSEERRYRAPEDGRRDRNLLGSIEASAERAIGVGVYGAWRERLTGVSRRGLESYAYLGRIPTMRLAAAQELTRRDRHETEIA